jgi:hypothetical protein
MSATETWLQLSGGKYGKRPFDMFHPQLWRLDLTKIDAARIRVDESTPGWDEQYIPDLTDGEFEVIAE